MFFKFIDILKSAFFKKKWKIGLVKINKKKFLNLRNLDFIEKNFDEIPINEERYTFIADPFPLNNQLILAEAMNKKNIGELVLIDLKTTKIIKRFSQFKKHISFPFLFFEKNKIFLIPEISHWSDQKIYEYSIKDNKISNIKNLKSVSSKKMKDPVIYKKNKNYFIFYSLKNSRKIEIAASKNLFGVFKKVNTNINLNFKSGIRMAGALLDINSDIYRIAQNNSSLYGNGIIINKVFDLDKEKYKEKYLRTLKFDKIYGPHTISFMGENLYFDYYTLEFDLSHFANKLRAKIFT